MMDPSILEPSQWGLLLMLLSMDITVPFHGAMGLPIRESDRLVPFVRRHILENRRAYEADPTAPPQLAARVLADLDVEFGPPTANQLYQWATATFFEVHADQPQWSAWQLVLKRWASNKAIAASLGLPPEKREQILNLYREHMGQDEIEALVTAGKAAPLSDWDLEMYAIHQLNNDDIADPYSKIEGIVEMNRFQLFWESLLPLLSPEEQDQLHRSAQQMLTDLGVWMPGDLAHPAALRRGR